MHKVKYEDKLYKIRDCKTIEKKTCVPRILNNTMYIGYLLEAFSTEPDYKEYEMISDSSILQNSYINSLKDDTTFYSVMKDLYSKTIEKSKPKDTVSMQKLLDIAVKFFAIYKLSNEGDYVGKICGGINFIGKTEKIRMPQVEAFCFSSIYNNYENGEYNMQEEFLKTAKELYNINLGIENNERLLRAQGAMFFLMKENENLKKMLILEYEKIKDDLPFVLIEDNLK